MLFVISLTLFILYLITRDRLICSEYYSPSKPYDYMCFCSMWNQTTMIGSRTSGKNILMQKKPEDCRLFFNNMRLGLASKRYAKPFIY